MPSPLWRLRSLLFADRVVRHRVVEATVMGQGASLVTASAMIGAAIVQFASNDASHVIAQFGGWFGSMLWAVAMLLASVLVWIGWLCRHPKFALMMEIPGTALMGLCLYEYAFAIWGQNTFDGNTFIILLCAAKGTNLLARAWMLARRMHTVTIVNEQLRGLL